MAIANLNLTMSTFLSGLSPWAARKVFLALASCLTAASAFAGELPSRYAIYHEEVVELEAALPGDLFLVESVTYPDSAKMRIPRNKLIFQSEGFRLDCSRGYNVDGRLYHMNIAFSDGRVWVQDVNVYERQGTVLLPLQSLECVFNGPEKGFQRGAQVVDEEGRFFEIVGFVGGKSCLSFPKSST